MKINSIVVFCWPGDVHLARLCLTSIRYFHPEIPLYLMKNVAQRDFDTTEIERRLKVITKGVTEPYGSSLGKVELLFKEELGRFLFIDSDQLMVGPVLEALEKNEAPFIVVPEYHAPGSEVIDRVYLNTTALKTYDPEFRLPPYFFNSGQFVATAGLIKREDFGRTMTWGNPLKLHDRHVFILGDQSLFNYLFQKLDQTGRIKLGTEEFMDLARTDCFWKTSLSDIVARKGPPKLFHWAGQTRTFHCLTRRGDIWRFFEKNYYDGVENGGWLRLKRTLEMAPMNAWRFAKASLHPFFRRFFPRRRCLPAAPAATVTSPV